MQEQVVRFEWKERLPPTCGGCGYNLTASMDTGRWNEGRCPECGQPFLRHELIDRAKDGWARLIGVEHANDMIHTGWYAAGGAAGFMILFNLLRAPALARAIGLLLGAATIAAGIQINRALRIPHWARPYLTVQPDYMKSAIMVLLGTVIITLAVLQPRLINWMYS